MALTLSGDGSIGPLSATEVGYLDGVTSAVQDQLNSKPTGGAGAWVSYTPTISGNWSQGNGTVTGKYTKIGFTVFFQASLLLGSTSSVGYGIQISLPVLGTGYGMANCDWLNTGSNYGTAQVKMGASTVVAYGIGSNGVEVSLASVQSWNSGDAISISGFYEAA